MADAEGRAGTRGVAEEVQKLIVRGHELCKQVYVVAAEVGVTAMTEMETAGLLPSIVDQEVVEQDFIEQTPVQPGGLKVDGDGRTARLPLIEGGEISKGEQSRR